MSAHLGWKDDIDDELDTLEQSILSEQATSGRPVANCSARTEAWRELLDDAADLLHQADREAPQWASAIERLTMLLAWERLQ